MIDNTECTIISPFDQVADAYDKIFERNLITQNIRSIIWNSYLEYFKTGSTVLDINCGTGTDAIFLAEHGISVIAIDSSARMIEKTKNKISSKGFAHLISPRNISYDNIADIQSTFDGCISNFGGVNCTDDLLKLSDKISSSLKPGGTFIACVMNKISITEVISHILRLEFKKGFRRFTNSYCLIKVGSSYVKVWYYTPQKFMKAFSGKFTPLRLYGLNIFSPNPNAHRFTSDHPKATQYLLKFDDLIRFIFPFRSMGDHFVIEMRRKN